MADGLTLTIGATQLAVLAKIAFDFLGPRIASGRNGSAGEKAPEYWQREFRSAIDEKIDQRLIPIMENQSRILEKQTETLESIAAVMANRARRR